MAHSLIKIILKTKNLPLQNPKLTSLTDVLTTQQFQTRTATNCVCVREETWRTHRGYIKVCVVVTFTDRSMGISGNPPLNQTSLGEEELYWSRDGGNLQTENYGYSLNVQSCLCFLYYSTKSNKSGQPISGCATCASNPLKQAIQFLCQAMFLYPPLSPLARIEFSIKKEKLDEPSFSNTVSVGAISLISRVQPAVSAFTTFI